MDNDIAIEPGRGEAREVRPIWARPTTSTRPDHNLADARVFIDGMSVMCPTAARDAIEIGFLEHMHSTVRIAVFRPDCTAEWAFNCPEGRKVRVEICKSTPRGMGVFYENGKSDLEDNLWMPDLEEWHGEPVTIQRHAKAALSAKLVLRDAVFYTKVNSVNPATREDLGTGDRVLLPTLGRVLGADITCEAADETIEIRVIDTDDVTGRETVIKSKSLPKAGGPYKIGVRTRATEEEDHLAMVYEHVVAMAGGRRFELSYLVPEPDWLLCGYFAGTASERFKDEVDTKRLMSTQFACQTHGGGGGPLPDIP